ncbi:MAG: hypothetical protein KBD00_05225 [Candidatus Peribacteraceae bacterium]|nr:hypothetical protein [Candidatus Peribacteraceae bacterium]
MKLLLLGPAGTFSHEAALSLFPDADIAFATNFDDLFDTLAQSSKKNNQKDQLLGFVPIENSLHGSVDEILDLLRETNIKLWRTYDAAIHHAFGCKDVSKITKVLSHPQALKQCRLWLKANYPKLEHVAVTSTAAAIQTALVHTSSAAIGVAKTMKDAGLPIIAEAIEGQDNTTRFAIVATADPFLDFKRSQMSIVVHPHEDYPGLLHKLLTPFKLYDVNLSRIENRPVGSKIGDYYFFLDFFGTSADIRTQKVLKELEELAEVKILGEW